MGAITPIAAGLSSIAGTLGTVNQIVGMTRELSGNGGAGREQDLALRQLQDRQRIAEQQAAQGAALSREKLAAESAAAEKQRQQALKRAVARQRANFGGQGVGASGGSAQALLLGLFDESEEEMNERTQMENLRSRAIDLDLSQGRSLNVLQATQLKERQKLDRQITGFANLF